MYRHVWGGHRVPGGCEALSRFSRFVILVDRNTATHTTSDKNRGCVSLSFAAPRAAASIQVKIHFRDDTQRTSFHTLYFFYFLYYYC